MWAATRGLTESQGSHGTEGVLSVWRYRATKQAVNMFPLLLLSLWNPTAIATCCQVALTGCVSVFSQKDVILLTLKGTRNFWVELAGASWPSLFRHSLTLDRRLELFWIRSLKVHHLFLGFFEVHVFFSNFCLTFLFLFVRKCRREKGGS